MFICHKNQLLLHPTVPLLVMITTTIMLTTDAAPVSLSGDITAGYSYYPDGGEIQAGGAILKVVDMANNANLVLNTSTLFEAHSLAFKGTLTITCGFSTVVPFTVRIVNSTSDPTASTSMIIYIKVTGYITNGSVIEVTGGTFDVKNAAYRFINGWFSITGGQSTFRVTGLTFIDYGVSGNPDTFIFDITTATSIMNNGTLEFSNNTLKADNIALLCSDYKWKFFYMLGTMEVLSGGTFYVTDNRVSLRDVTISGACPFSMYYIHARNTVQVKTNGSIVFARNVFHATNLNTTSGTTTVLLAMSSVVLTVTSSGSIHFLNNEVSVIDSYSSTAISFTDIYGSPAPVLSNNATITSSGSRYYYNSVDSKDGVYQYLLRCSDGISSSSGTTITIENGITELINCSGSSQRVGFLELGSSVTLSNTIINLLNNSIIWGDAVLPNNLAGYAPTITLLDISSPINTSPIVGGTYFNLRTNAIFGPPYAIVRVVTVVPGSGAVSIQLRDVDIRGSLLNTSTALLNADYGNPTTTISTCNNSVFGSRCVKMASNIYPCFGTGSAYPISVGCGETLTKTRNTITSTPTNNDSTITTTNPTPTPVTPTLTDHTSTPTASRSANRSATQTLATLSASLSFDVTNSTSRTSSKATPTTTPNFTTSKSINTHTATNMPTLTTTHLPTTSTTPSKSLRIIPPCNHTCADIITAFVIPSSSTTIEDATTNYWRSYNSSAPRMGCRAVIMGYDATNNGAVARVFIHVDTGSVSANASYPQLGLLLPTSPSSTINAVSASTNFSRGVIIVDMRRMDANPVSSVDGRVTLLPGGFMCTTSTPNNNNIVGMPWVNIALDAPLPPLTIAEQQAVAVVSAISPGMQTVAAMTLLRCSPGNTATVETETTIRALVPVALSGTCAGAVQGAILAISMVGVICTVATLVVMRMRGVGWVEAAAVTRCPGAALGAWGFLQMGFVVCGGRLVTTSSGSAGDVALGVIGVLLGAALPAVSVALAWAVVSRRCYRIGLTAEVVARSSRVGLWVRSMLLPEYELDMDGVPQSKAYSTIVGRTRLVGSIWAAVPMSQPVIMIVVVFVQGVGCSAVLITAGVLMLAVAAVCQVWYRPHRIHAANYLQGFTTALSAAVLIVGAKLSTHPTDEAAVLANRIIAMLQLGLAVVRIGHGALSFAYMALWRNTIFERVQPDGKHCLLSSSSPETTTDNKSANTPPTPVFQYLISTVQQQEHDNALQQPLVGVAPVIPSDAVGGAAVVVGAVFNAVLGDNGINGTPSHSKTVATHNVTEKAVPEKGVVVNNKKKKPARRIVDRAISYFATPKNTRSFNDDIVSTMINNHHGYVPMERPYTLLWEGRDGPADSDDLELRSDETITPSSPTSSFNNYARSISSLTSSSDKDDDNVAGEHTALSHSLSSSVNSDML